MKTGLLDSYDVALPQGVYGEAPTYDFVRLVGNPELPAIQNTAKRTATPRLMNIDSRKKKNALWPERWVTG